MPQLIVGSYLGQFLWCAVAFGLSFLLINKMFIRDFLSKLNSFDENLLHIEKEIADKEMRIALLDEKILKFDEEIRKYRLSLIHDFVYQNNISEELKMIEIRNRNGVYRKECLFNFDIALKEMVDGLCNDYHSFGSVVVDSFFKSNSVNV